MEVFRGFAVADDVAPFVVVNDNDSEPAWSFTLLHELVHLLLGQTGISGARPGTGVEQFCNHVAAEWMLPARTLDRIEIDRDPDVAECRQRIGEFARPRNLSHTIPSSPPMSRNRRNSVRTVTYPTSAGISRCIAATLSNSSRS